MLTAREALVARRRNDSARLGRTVSPSLHRHPHQRRGGFPRLARMPGLPCGSPWRATRDASDRRLLPNTFTTNTRASRVSRAVERPWTDRRFTTPRLASAGERTDDGGAFSSPRRASDRASGAPVASLARPALLPSESRSSSRRQDRFGHKPRERGVAPAIRSTFHRKVASSSRCSSYRFRSSRD
jgi:hypothetical protein